ncbi:hypothetical protein [Naumannella cuiyingiana]|uniref:Lipoprotein n=1 Tax=Naumannella cuiyingiana TaxID=1347891 RepID=A0A7Z0D737_9ACTN|nr:hypothetical protein [Naumannella cuiyingiana]NYI70074.1 hypothetical protein [Naumannella cuiyingiana]
MKIKSLTLGVLGAAMSGMLLLAGCGGAPAVQDRPTEPAQTQDAGDEQGGEETSAGEASPDTGGESTDSSGGEAAGKPSLDDVKSGLSTWLKENDPTGTLGSLPQDMVKKLTDCWAEAAYDQLSAETLQQLADATTPSNAGDLQKLSEIFSSQECQQAVTG